MSVWHTAWRVAWSRPALFVSSFLLWIGVFCWPLVTGLLLRAVLDALCMPAVFWLVRRGLRRLQGWRQVEV